MNIALISGKVHKAMSPEPQKVPPYRFIISWWAGLSEQNRVKEAL